MPKGPGVSTERRDDGRWRVRWRERVADDSERGWKWASREKVVSDEATALTLRAKTLRSLETGELPDLAPVRTVAPVATVDDVLAGWCRQQRALKRAAATLAGHVSVIARILRELRAEHQIPEGRAVPGTLLTRDTIIRLSTRLADAGLSEGTVYPTVRSLVAAWVWACDDPATYPGLAPAPRDPSALLPVAPLYSPGTPPTLAEVDAMLRELAKGLGRIALPIAVIERYTGLRVGAVMEIRIEDVNLSACTLVVRAGKSRREKAERRTVAISEHLRDYLAPLVGDRPGSDLLVRRRSDSMGNRKGGPSVSIGAAWKAATAAGHARRETWDKGGTRRHSRPDHAIRAAVIAHLRTAGVDRAVVKVLVGQALDLQEKHYLGDAVLPLLQDAVTKIPPIDWDEPAAAEALPDNVSQFRR